MNSAKTNQDTKTEDFPLSKYPNQHDDKPQQNQEKLKNSCNPKTSIFSSPSSLTAPNISKIPSELPNLHRNYDQKHPLEERTNYSRVASSVLSEVISDESDKIAFGFLLVIIIVFYLEQIIQEEYTNVAELFFVALLIILCSIQYLFHRSENFRFLHLIQGANCIAVLIVMCFWVKNHLENREDEITEAFTLAIQTNTSNIIGRQQVISSIRQEAQCFLQGAIIFRLQECLSKHLFPVYRLVIILASTLCMIVLFIAKQIAIQDGISGDIIVKGLFLIFLLISFEYSALKFLISYVISFSTLKKYYTLSQCSSCSNTHGLSSNTLQIEVNPSDLSEYKVIQGNQGLSRLLLTDPQIFFQDFEIDPLTIEQFDPLSSSNDVFSPESSTSLEKEKSNNNLHYEQASSRPFTEVYRSKMCELRSTSRKFIDLKILKLSNIQDNPPSSMFRSIKNGQKSGIKEKDSSKPNEEERRKQQQQEQKQQQENHIIDTSSFLSLSSIIQDNTIKSIHLRGRFQAGETETQNTIKYLSITIQKYTNLFQRTVVIASIADVTAMEEINNLQRELKFKEKMFANVTHDLRTPLYVIMFSAEKIKEIFAMNAYNTITEQRENLAANLKEIEEENVGVLHDSINTMLANSHLMKCIIQDIIDDNRNRMGKLELEVNSFDLMEVLSEMKKLTEVLLWEKRNNIEIHFQVSKEVEKNSNIFTDQQRLKQVLMNLITNAIKFTKKGGIVVKVNKVLFRDLDNLERYFNAESFNAVKHQPLDQVKEEIFKFGLIQFQVIDSGIGMTPLVRQNLFTPYKTFNNQNMNKHGIGLGLTICQSIVEKMGPFHLKVASKEQAGSKFTFYIYNNLEQMLLAMKNAALTQDPLEIQKNQKLPEIIQPQQLNNFSHKTPDEECALGRSDCNLITADKTLIHNRTNNGREKSQQHNTNQNNAISSRSAISAEQIQLNSNTERGQWSTSRQQQQQQQQHQQQLQVDTDINKSQLNEVSIMIAEQQQYANINKVTTQDTKGQNSEQNTYHEFRDTTNCMNMKRMSFNQIQITDCKLDHQQANNSNQKNIHNTLGDCNHNNGFSNPNETSKRDDQDIIDFNNRTFSENDNSFGKANNSAIYAPIKRYSIPQHFKQIVALQAERSASVNCIPEQNIQNSQMQYPSEDRINLSYENTLSNHNTSNNNHRLTVYGNTVVDSISLADQPIVSFARSFKDKFIKESQLVDAIRLQEDETFDSETLLSLDNNQERTTEEEAAALFYMSPLASEIQRPSLTEFSYQSRQKAASQVKLRKSCIDSNASGLILSTLDRQNHVTNCKMTDSVQLNQLKKFKFGNGQQKSIVEIVQEKDEVHKLNILICDDNPFNIKMLQSQLQKLKNFDLKIDSCLGGEEAIVKFQQQNKPNSLQPYHYIFLDWNMPIMDGYETSSRIKFYVKDEQYLDCPIIICSAYDDNAEINKCLRHGTDAILPKPVSIEKLRNLLQDFQENQALLESTLPRFQSATFPYHGLQISNVQRQ